MAAEQGTVRDNDVIAHAAVVSHMSVGHQEIVGADPSVRLDPGRAMNGHMFPKDIMTPDADRGRSASILQILRSFPDHRTRKKKIMLPNYRVAGQVHMRAHQAVRAQPDARVDYGICAD